MEELLAAIVDDDRSRAKALLKTAHALATQPIGEPRLYQDRIQHWMYVGDTALHLAAAGYRVEIIQLLLDAGTDVNPAMNHRWGTPLHYAADGPNTGPTWDSERQVRTIQFLLDAGACINAQDKNGATALHRAVRTRSAAAVKCLLAAGANPTLRNKPGSTPFHLAVQNTGRGGSGSEEAHAAQREIIQTFRSAGVSTKLTDGKGQTVEECARQEWIRELLTA